MRGPRETDGAFLVKRFETEPGDAFTREKHYEDFDVPYVLRPGPGTPNRTHARFAGSRVLFQRRALRLERPDLRRELRRTPLAVVDVEPREAEALIDLARESMVTRARDLYSFKYPDPRDVRMIECGDGLQFACIGLVPERRLMLEAVYAFLMLKNGVPLGYVLVSSLFNSSEIAYNVFESFRGGESGYVYGRVLAAARHVFGAEAFTIDPYQLGHDNAEGLKSGAWWFYYKLGFRPHDPGRAAGAGRGACGDEARSAAPVRYADVTAAFRGERLLLHGQAARGCDGAAAAGGDRGGGVAVSGWAVWLRARGGSARLLPRGDEAARVCGRCAASTRGSGRRGSGGVRW